TLIKRSENNSFEGMGDVSWLGRSKFILGGYGFRTNKSIYPILTKVTNTPIAIFELKNPKFYHLDTCLSVLNSTTALVCKEAFTAAGYELLQALFSNLLEVPLSEADSPGFACNAHCPDETHVIIQQGNKRAVELIKQHGFVPIEVDTSEFIKSGGSVYCMKLMYF
ncbi:MAG: arginine deiminase-related protein, partial [Bdellovibrionota bacterium]